MKSRLEEKINFKKVSICFDILAYILTMSLMNALPSAYAGIPFFISKVYFVKGIIDVSELVIRKKQLKSFDKKEIIKKEEKTIKQDKIIYDKSYNKYYENCLKPKVKVKRKYN